MIQPTTADVVIRQKNLQFHLSCETKGASIGYQIGENMGSKKWLLYTKPIEIKPNEKINARAIRIGFRASNISTN